MLYLKFALALLGLLLLGGCATQPPRLPAMADIQNFPATFLLNGRIGVQHDGQGFSGNLSWRHNGGEDEIQLRSPLGQTVARIQRNAKSVTLDTPEGHYTAQSPAELTEQVLGWRLPLEGMQHWVLGRPTPDGAVEIERDDSLRVTRLRQQEWSIEYRDYRMEGNFVLPSRIVMRNDTLEIKLVVDNWELP
ncbi:MAG: lipoprotein insertase outer membrane protein LolB [Sulfurimicrobium sp.]|nr:lipoprotein insertase outer membrane protein LolB [Sulfurimicrobium sp.]